MGNELTYYDSGAGERGVVDIEQGRAIQEVQAAVIMARRFPRDMELSRSRIKSACKRKALAESAMYEYPRGKVKVTGPSIRLAEVCAQAWGNIDFGIRELSQYGGASEVEAFCWDLETNTRQTKTFKVPHKRFTKSGSYDLTDPRDIYEAVANQGARRLRACILGVIPGDIVDEAVQECENTLKLADKRPTSDVINSMIDQFKSFNVSVAMLETKIGHKLNESTSRSELVTLGKIYNSLKDGMSEPKDWFGKEASIVSPDAKKIHNFNNYLQASGYLGDIRVSRFLDVTAESSKKTVDEIKAMAWDEKDRFFAAFEKWAKAQTKTGGEAKEPVAFDRPYTARPDPMNRPEPNREYPPEADAPPMSGEGQEDDSGGSDEEKAALFESDEWNELQAMQHQFPNEYKEHIAGKYKLNTLGSINAAITKLNKIVGDDIPL